MTGKEDADSDSFNVAQARSRASRVRIRPPGSNHPDQAA